MIEIEKGKKTDITQKEYTDFLLFLYFGKSNNYLNNCIDRAYRDFNRTMHGFAKHKNKDVILKESKTYLKESLIEIKNDNSMISQINFDVWHKSTCYRLINIFYKYEYQNFTIGQAQKWINMSLKYIFLHGEIRIDGFNRVYEYCHIPIDNIILNKLEYKKFNTSWSRINDYNIYIDFQKYIRDISRDEIPLDFEFRLFMRE